MLVVVEFGAFCVLQSDLDALLKHLYIYALMSSKRNP